MLLLLTKPFHSNTDFKGRMRAWAAEQLSPAARAGGGGADWAALPTVYVEGAHVPQGDLPRLYRAAGAFVLPSRCVLMHMWSLGLAYLAIGRHAR